MQRRLATMVVLGLVALFAGCGDTGSNSDTETVHVARVTTMGVSFEGRIGPANAGIRLSEERGYFEDRGRDIWTGAPVGPARSVVYVARGTDEFGITHLPQLMIAREEGFPVVAIGSLVPQTTIAMIWLKKSGIRDIRDLKGKTIAIPGLKYQERLLEAVLRRAGLTRKDVRIKEVAYDLLPVLLDGRADAIFGGSWNVQGAALEARGVEPVIKRAPALGIPNYDELVLFTTEDNVATEPDLVRDFLASVAQGTAAVVEDPEVAMKSVGSSDEADPEATAKTTRAEVEATVPLLSKTGYLDPARVANLERWMRKEGMIRQEPPASELLTNEYLASP